MCVAYSYRVRNESKITVTNGLAFSNQRLPRYHVQLNHFIFQFYQSSLQFHNNAIIIFRPKKGCLNKLSYPFPKSLLQTIGKVGFQRSSGIREGPKKERALRNMVLIFFESTLKSIVFLYRIKNKVVFQVCLDLSFIFLIFHFKQWTKYKKNETELTHKEGKDFHVTNF